MMKTSRANIRTGQVCVNDKTIRERSSETDAESVECVNDETDKERSNEVDAGSMDTDPEMFDQRCNPSEKTSEKSIELNKQETDDDDNELSALAAIASASHSSDIVGVFVAVQRHALVIQTAQETIEHGSAIPAGSALLGWTMREASSSTSMRDGCFQQSAIFRRGVKRTGRHINVTYADDEMYVYIREFEGDCFESNAEQVSETQVTQKTVEMPVTHSDDRVTTVLVVQRDFTTSVGGESTSKRSCILMSDGVFHASQSANDFDQRDVTPMTVCDRQGATTAATTSTTRMQCTVDDFVMFGQQAEIEDVKSDRDTKIDPSRKCK